jgi:hypothetical protein
MYAAHEDSVEETRRWGRDRVWGVFSCFVRVVVGSLRDHTAHIKQALPYPVNWHLPRVVGVASFSAGARRMAKLAGTAGCIGCPAARRDGR